MLKLLLLALAFMVLPFELMAQAADYDTCCICVGDPDDLKSVGKECHKWLNSGTRKNCEYKKVIDSKDSPFLDAGKTCRSIDMFGGFHGLSYLTAYPFKLARGAAQRYFAEEVTYDGSTCLVFNNIEIAKSQANTLASLEKKVKFIISGNQNIGVVAPAIPFITKVKEVPSMASKVTFEIDSGDVQMSYASCSKPNKMCGFADRDFGNFSDSNTKFCMDGEEVVEQKCCPDKKREWGKWSVPGQNC